MMDQTGKNNGLTSFERLVVSDGQYIAYRSHKVSDRSKPCILFCGGFMSDMDGTKASALHQLAMEHNRNFVRFDYSGHGLSSGLFTEGTIGGWRDNALKILDTQCEGPTIVVGSSMGGWIMLLLALARPQKVKALVGVAVAPDFTEDLIWNQLSIVEQQELIEKGEFRLHSEYGADPYPITRGLIEEGRQHLLLRSPIDIDCPVRLIHGMKDDDVPYRLSISLAEKLKTSDVYVTLSKGSDHRMSSSEDIELLWSAIENI